jgi:phosphatidylglycerophosphate synthase
VSTVIAFTMCFSQIEATAFFYLLGQGLDAVDGTVARAFNQCTLRSVHTARPVVWWWCGGS